RRAAPRKVEPRASTRPRSPSPPRAGPTRRIRREARRGGRARPPRRVVGQGGDGGRNAGLTSPGGPNNAQIGALEWRAAPQGDGGSTSCLMLRFAATIRIQL